MKDIRLGGTKKQIEATEEKGWYHDIGQGGMTATCKYCGYVTDGKQSLTFPCSCRK